MALDQFDGESDTPAPDAESKGELRKAVVTMRNKLFNQHPYLKATMPTPRKSNVWVRQSFTIEPYFAHKNQKEAINLQDVDKIRLRLRGMIERLTTHKPRKMSVGLEESSTTIKLPVAHEHLLAALADISSTKRELIANAIMDEYAETIILRLDTEKLWKLQESADEALKKLYEEMATGRPVLDWR